MYHDPATTARFAHFTTTADLPYATADLPGIGGAIKRVPASFRVDELPPPPPDNLVNAGGACHYWIVIQREGMNTHDVQDFLASVLGYPDAKEIGASGLKDKRALCTQTFSVPSYSRKLCRHVTKEEIVTLIVNHPGDIHVQIIGTPQCSSKKLRRSMHAGNRFEIVISSLTSKDLNESLRLANAVRKRLESEGWPNYYGEQRFSKGTQGAVRGARLLESLQSAERGGSRKRLRASMTKSRHKMLMLSAYSSMFFNLWLSKRIQSGMFGKLVEGDLVEKLGGTRHVVLPLVPSAAGGGAAASSSTTTVPSTSSSSAAPSTSSTTTTTPSLSKKKYVPPQSFATNSPNSSVLLQEFHASQLTYTGPMYGFRLERPPENTPAYVMEEEISQLSTVEEATYRMVNVFGTRRAGRLALAHMELDIQKHADGLVFSFSLPNGAYATSFLREFMKVPVTEDLQGDADSDGEGEKDGRSSGDSSSLRKKKRQKLQRKEQPRPLLLDEITTKMNLAGMNYTATLSSEKKEIAANDEQEEEETATTFDYKMLMLKSTRGKVRKITCTIACVSSPRTIQEWTIKLGDKKCCRLANERDLQKSIGCQSLPELSPFSVCTDSTLPPHVTLAVDSVLLEREGTLMLKYGCLGDAVEMKVEDYLVLAKEGGVTVRTLEF